MLGDLKPHVGRHEVVHSYKIGNSAVLLPLQWEGERTWIGEETEMHVNGGIEDDESVCVSRCYDEDR